MTNISQTYFDKNYKEIHQAPRLY